MAINTSSFIRMYDDPYMSEKDIRRYREEHERHEYHRQQAMNAVASTAVKNALSDLKEVKVMISSDALKEAACSPKISKNPTSTILLLCEI